MPYPLSTIVTDGMPTGYAQYNNLRLDALTLGVDTTDGVALGTALARYQDNLKLEPLATNRLRCPYDALRPATLMINGAICQAAANVDISPGTFSGAAALWYIFATRTAGATTFTLTANTSSAESALARRVGEIYWTGAALNYASLIVYGPGRPGLYYASAYRGAVQSIPNITSTAISFDTEEADTADMYAAGTPTRLTIVHSGLYVITGSVTLAAGAYQISLNLRINGATNLAYATGTGTAATWPAAATSLVRSFAAADYLELVAWHNQGAAVNTIAGLCSLNAAALSA